MTGSSLHVLPVQSSFQLLGFDIPLCGPHVGSVPHITHGSTSQCLAAHCTFALPPRLLLAQCSHERHPRPAVSVAPQHQRFGNSHQALEGLMEILQRLDPFRHFANLSKRESIETYGLEEDFC
jgi:hypothetical protein